MDHTSLKSTWGHIHLHKYVDSNQHSIMFTLDNTSIVNLICMRGMPGSLPDPMKKKWNEACASGLQAKNAVINSLVPKGCGYGHILCISAGDITRFQQLFGKDNDNQWVDGIGFTDLAMQWGHGNYELGSQANQRALADGELQQRDGLRFRKGRKISIEVGNTTFMEGSDKGELEDCQHK